ncbi:ACS family hexuronate transporter-like MFS transporter [Dysgonomonas sp. PFB1-18]|uniref:MFS transporter n=1 Tax=unclassified Dysgonomonas TaxID=2630389 RepID=UPI0024759B5E|nr:MULTISPECIES: MFS transporter [unclassified Dysgonomonas]MDH6307967.1 ACS family hexuronate transporter-like MFS transporter [Dysgonomonas sp. PF1-14]MDH6339506.1 ACS family hexuronate transporter-like MFS transporter [Dysgonomonas sp. PF1-16]MDH6381157.1 ACS family hexuronate transporter-like MFS transporter [Dysgonomonas sp. PFB1-18]MDH6398369.1 ACS family hexuronate transporter-like MFS transporter [Dysgonomonas sp. PF1-23]
MNNTGNTKMTNYRWMICAMLFFATTINYLDRQVLSLTWKDFISPEFHWTNDHYGTITALFSIFYAVSMLFAGKFVDWMDTKKGFLWAIGVWSFGAIIHAFCGIATSGIVAGEWFVGFEGAREAIATVSNVGKVASVSVVLFVFARLVLAIGEAGNFPAAIKATAEYFPKKDRAFATSIFNAGATVGALAAPVTIPVIAKFWGWEMSFIIIGALGFVWMGFWVFVYKKPEVHPKVNTAELAYIQSDKADETPAEIAAEEDKGKKITFAQAFRYRQTWAFAFGKFMTDGVWWFFLFWAPAYLSSVYGIKSSDTAGQLAIFVLYAITLLSIIGGWLPSYFVDKKGMNPYAGRMKAMLIFAFFPLLALLAQPLGGYSYWIPVIIIGIAGAAHQAWSANIFSTIGDMFPKKAIATITGIGGMAGGIGSFLINKGSGALFDFTQKNWSTINGQALLEKYPQLQDSEATKALLKQHNVGSIEEFLKTLSAAGDTVVDGISSGYMIIFSICAVAYLIGWIVMKILVPKYKPITDL